MRRVGKMLKKEYEAADGIAEAIRNAVAEGDLKRESESGAVDFKTAGEAVKVLKAVEELKRSIAGETSGATSGIIEIGRRPRA